MIDLIIMYFSFFMALIWESFCIFASKYIHVLCGRQEAKFWLEPQVELAKNTGIPEHKLNEIKRIVEKYADNFKEQFRQHIGKRIDD